MNNKNISAHTNSNYCDTSNNDTVISLSQSITNAFPNNSDTILYHIGIMHTPIVFFVNYSTGLEKV